MEFKPLLIQSQQFIKKEKSALINLTGKEDNGMIKTPSFTRECSLTGYDRGMGF